jgi:hypothetical protein
MRSKVRARSYPFPGGWLVLSFVTCLVLFWLGAQAGDHLAGGLSAVAVLTAFTAVCVAPLLLLVTVLWGGFAFFRWLWAGERR